MTAAPVISARGLTRDFGAKRAVDALDLDIPPARITGFLGPNGSGKSTTIRMLCGLLTPTAGTVEVLGYKVPGDSATIKPLIGYMTQKFSLYGDLSVRENLEFVASVYGITRRAARERTDVLLTRYWLDNLERQRVGTLSGGQRQRVALAAAVIHEPKLLLLDEPTSAVDPSSRRDFWETLFDLAAAGTTILVSTHYMDEAERCHHLAILDNGRKVADGSPGELAGAVPYRVVELAAADTQALRTRLVASADILSITQLGQRLRILVAEEIDDPVEFIRHQLPPGQATLSLQNPSLEDVFVAATELGALTA